MEIIILRSIPILEISFSGSSRKPTSKSRLRNTDKIVNRKKFLIVAGIMIMLLVILMSGFPQAGVQLHLVKYPALNGTNTNLTLRLFNGSSRELYYFSRSNENLFHLYLIETPNGTSNLCSSSFAGIWTNRLDSGASIELLVPVSKPRPAEIVVPYLQHPTHLEKALNDLVRMTIGATTVKVHTASLTIAP